MDTLNQILYYKTKDGGKQCLVFICFENQPIRWRDRKMMRNIVKEQTVLHRRRKNMGLPPLKKDVIKPAVLRESVS